MASIDRTTYPRFKGSLSNRELRTLYRPGDKELRFVAKHARSADVRLALLVRLKCHQQLGYLPALSKVPSQVVEYLCSQLRLPAGTSLRAGDAHMRQHHRDLIHGYLDIQRYHRGGQHVAADVVRKSAYTMSDPADLINAAIEQLIQQRYELPGYSILDRLVARIRQQVHNELYASVSKSLSAQDSSRLEELLKVRPSEQIADLARIKESPGPASLKQMRRWVVRLAWLNSLVDVDTATALAAVAHTKRRQFAAEARTLTLDDMRQVSNTRRRQTLLICLLHQARVQTRDDMVTMFLKRMRRTHKAAAEELKKLRDERRGIEERMMKAFSGVVDQAADGATDATLGRSLRRALATIGSLEEVRLQYKQILAYYGNDYLPMLWGKHRSHRSAIMKLIDLLQPKSATQDQKLIDALKMLQRHQHSRRGYLPNDIDMSFASARWRSLVEETSDGKNVLNRRQLEVCVLSYVAKGLRCGDLFVPHSEAYADYREQLLPWKDCEKRLEQCCKTLRLPSDGARLVKSLKAKLTRKSRKVDADFKNNKDLTIDNEGRAHLKKTDGKPTPDGAAGFMGRVRKAMPERHLLDILKNVHHWTNFTRHFGPLSGATPRMQDRVRRYLFTVFGNGCGLGPSQTSQHAVGDVTLRILDRVNKQHVTTDGIEAATRDIIAEYARFDLPSFWGTGRAAVADGTHVPLIENNLLGERHIRYGAYGGIAYHHISDTYIALFTNLVACGVWEAVYILDGLMNNTSVLQPDKVYADTQGQAEPIFGLALLLGVRIMPRMRTWNSVSLYRSDGRMKYDNIDVLFTRTINWRLIEAHFKDMMQVVISIQEGRVLPSMLMQKLGTYGRHNKLNQAFRELGRVARTLFLLDYISDKNLRRCIQGATTKVESFNAFCDWISFGGDVATSDDPVENEKRVKYTTLVANAVMLQNVADLTNVLVKLARDGHPITRELLSGLSPYLTRHIRRFGQFFLDIEPAPPPLIPERIPLTGSQGSGRT